MHTLLAINWEPQLRGILIIIISTVVLCGSVYLIIGTNVGARLGFLISLASLAGWMMLMGAMWWAFGIGLVGTDSSWKPMTGAAILQDTASFREVGLIEAAIDDSGDFPAQATAISDALRADGWKALGESDTAFGQAASAGGFVIEADGTFAAGQYKPVNVFDKGGERYPKIGESIDFLAFKHKPRYVIVEIAPLVPQRERAGPCTRRSRGRRLAVAPLRVPLSRPWPQASSGGHHLLRLRPDLRRLLLSAAHA